jgi:hypothetical protein
MLTQELVAEYHRESATATARRDLLVRLAREGGREALATFADLVASRPPDNIEDALVAFAPLLRTQNGLAVDALFPRLLDATTHPVVAAIVLDVANHFVRTGHLHPHPACDRASRLAELFQSVAIRLERLPNSPPADAAAWEEQRRTAEEGFALLVALCDTLALVGDPSVCDRLRTALELPHRRLRTEVAAALARLGQADGIRVLAQMASESVVRSRAIAYLEELGLADEIPMQFRSAAARAEGTLAQWLASPMQFGIGPQTIELLDERSQYWPGYTEPVACFLLRYGYATPQGELGGVGIVGPLVHAVAHSPEDLSVDDFYALFAGYDAEHETIQETPFAELPNMEQSMVETLFGELHEAFADAKPVTLGHFFGERHIVATVTRHGLPGVVVLDAGEPHWYPAGNPLRPATTAEAYQIHKGRKLLRTFNSLGQNRGQIIVD